MSGGPIPPQQPAQQPSLAAEPGSAAPRSLRRLLDNLPRSVRAIAVLIVFLFAINLFTGFDPVWFHWPASAGLSLILLRLSLARRGGDPGNEKP